tara:strand:+ start:1173 stop:2840 length:1668 start_codon:yes stop_codon:yes gene_type:complete
MDLILHYLQETLSGIGPFVLLLGLLVFVHELGHFLVAKWCGVRVEVFSLGFGKKLLQYKHGDTTYCISMIPLGGYVKMFGDNFAAEVSEEEKSHSFIHKPVSQRIAVVLAGPLMNLFFAIFLFTAIGFIGDRQPAAVVGDIASTTQAYKDGFRPGDKILSVENKSVDGWTQLIDRISQSNEKELSFQVQRGNESIQISSRPEISKNENIFSSQEKVPQIEGLSFESNAALIGVPSPQSPAALAGLKNLDLILKVNEKDVSSFRSFKTAVIEGLKTGSEVQMEVQSFAEGKRGPKRTISLASSSTDFDALGIEFAETYVLKVKDPSPAHKAGLKSGDKIVSIDGKPVSNWTNILDSIKNFDPKSEGNISLLAMREGKNIPLQLVPEMTQLMNEKGQEENRFTIGILSSNLNVGPETVLYRPDGLLGKFSYGLSQTWKWTEFTVMSMVRLFQGVVSYKNIGGVITIGRVANHSYDAGLSVFLKTMAIISINLFLLNLLPVPVLDGGHLVFYGLEALKGSPVSMKKLEIAQQVGLMLLLLLMAFALFNDVSNLFSSQW